MLNLNLSGETKYFARTQIQMEVTGSTTIKAQEIAPRLQKQITNQIQQSGGKSTTKTSKITTTKQIWGKFMWRLLVTMFWVPDLRHPATTVLTCQGCDQCRRESGSPHGLTTGVHGVSDQVATQVWKKNNDPALIDASLFVLIGGRSILGDFYDETGSSDSQCSTRHC